MKNLIFGLAIAATTSVVGMSASNLPESPHISIGDLTVFFTSSEVVSMNAVSLKEIVNTYLQLKNALTEDNSTAAATAGKKLVAVFKNFDKSSLSDAQKKTYEDISADAIENAEHIGANGGKIAHQREHFDLLSKDIYDLVKTFGAGQVLYKDYDSMFNNGKGAFWLSETKEIKNPYMGKAMLTSGSIQEEIK